MLIAISQTRQVKEITRWMSVTSFSSLFSLFFLKGRRLIFSPSESPQLNCPKTIITMSNLLWMIVLILNFTLCVWQSGSWKALMAKMLIRQLIKGGEEYLGCHGWLLGCRASVVCFEALIMAAQTHNYELSEVRKWLEMNRQRGSTTLEGTHGRWWKWMSLAPKTRYSSSAKKKKECETVAASRGRAQWKRVKARRVRLALLAKRAAFRLQVFLIRIRFITKSDS